MIKPILAPVIHRGGQIEIPALHFSLAGAHDFFGAGADGDGRHSRRSADGFLRSAEADVDALIVRRATAQQPARRRCPRSSSAPSSSATFRKSASLVKTPDDVSPCARPMILIFLPLPARRTSSGSTVLPIRSFDFGDFRGGALSNLVHAVGKKPVDGDDALIAFFQSVEDGGFDAAGTGRGKRHGQAIFGLKNLPQQKLGFIHAGFEPRIEVADERAWPSRDIRADPWRRARREHQSYGGFNSPTICVMVALLNRAVPVRFESCSYRGRPIAPHQERESAAEAQFWRIQAARRNGQIGRLAVSAGMKQR